MKKGNAANAKLNGEWGKHVKKDWKRLTSKLRRAQGKRIIFEMLSKLNW